MKRKISLLCVIILTLLCMSGCGKKETEVEILIHNYQDAIKAGRFEEADACCQLVNGQRGAYYYELLLGPSDEDVVFITAAKELYLETYEIYVVSVEIDGNHAVANVKENSLDIWHFMDRFPSMYTYEQLTECSVEECKKILKEDSKDYYRSVDGIIVCEKIDNQWKITEFK